MNNELQIPQHIGIIMDGNGRWATKRGLARSMGHQAGADNMLSLCLHIVDTGVKYLSLYAFSTENFQREGKEVSYLMDLFVKMFFKQFHIIMEHNIRVVFSGRREPLPEKVLKAMDEVTMKSADNTGAVLNICLNYGGQTEIVDMTRKLCQQYKEGSLKLEEITPTMIQHQLYQDLPPLDFVIRTSGEMRLSNFMLYQASYSEFYFTNTLFPDFNEVEFDKALVVFQQRHRKFGGS